MAQVEVVLIGAEDLKNVSNGIWPWGSGGRKMSSYVVCWVDPSDKQRSKMVSKGGKDPEWNETLWLPVDSNTLANPYACLHLQLMSSSRRRAGKDALIGSAWIALHQIAPFSSSNTVTLPVHRSSGRIQGLVRLKLQLTNPPFKPPESNNVVMGYAASDQLMMCRPSAPPIPASPPPPPPSPPPAAGATNGVLLGLLGGALAALLLGDLFMS